MHCLSCAAFLDLTSKLPEANLPEISQLMWVHLEEPPEDTSVLHSSGERLWFLTTLRDFWYIFLAGSFDAAAT